MLDRQTQEGYLARQLGLDEASLESWQRFPITRAGPSAQCLRTGQPMFLQSLDEVLRAFPELRATWRRLGAHALVTVPLTVSAEVVGAMSFTYDEPRTFPLEDREFYLAVARQAAQALDRARLRSETQQLLDALERERRRLADVFRQAPVAVAVLRGRATEELVFEMANPRYLELVPPEPHPVGMRVFDALPDAGAPLLDVLRRVLATGETVVVQEMQVGVDRDGDGVAEDYWFTATYHPLREQGEIGAIVAVITEVTENVRARQEAERLRAEAEGANRAKGEFLAVMSHELRTPLNAIGGYVELIELGIRGPVTEEQRMDLARIQQSQRHLLGLINEVLNYARLETGSVNYDMVRVPLRDALRSAEALVAPQAHLKGLSLRTDDCPESMAVVADPEKLRQVLVNLLSNAVKFTDAGGAITLGARARGNTVAITVTDTGIGIAGEQMERIFEPFVQVRSDLTRTAEGTGLGLAISRDLARGMGGDLTAESVLGEGSRFVITLPAAAANEGAGGRRDRP
jgi:signal transduction histidine kinase